MRLAQSSILDILHMFTSHSSAGPNNINYLMDHPPPVTMGSRGTGGEGRGWPE